ncbi:hypothetical protein HDU97_007525 [Phlyctochytrium planicorne]|nr:hypothetical protein HDU97_007525 [Phlyctochytrium planicorne]
MAAPNDDMPGTTSRIQEIGPGYFNIRAPFKFLFGLVDIGTQMSLIRLKSGKFLAIDTVELTPSLKDEIDKLTDNGSLIEAVIGTHPYHTLYFPGFYEKYPNTKYYGTPRHLRIFPDIPWAGDVNEESVRKLWEPEVEMRIPDGAEFVNPLPERTNHFSNVFVFHKASRTIHVDDTIMYFKDPGMALRMAGFSDGRMDFHRSITGPGLLPTPDAPQKFQCWVAKLIHDWDFDNISSAHNGCKIGGAKKQLQDTLDGWEERLANLSKTRAADSGDAAWSSNWKDTCECG